MQPIPTYALYGENLEEGDEDILHFEQLRIRSAEHNWSIQAHKHDTLWQLFYLETSGTIIRLGDKQIHTTEPLFAAIPPLAVHAFRFPPNAIGGAISVRFPILHAMLAELPEGDLLAKRWSILKQSDPAFAAALNAYRNLVANFSSKDLLRNQALKVDLIAILISIIRQTTPGNIMSEHKISSKDEEIRQFCKLAEENFRLNWTSERYAAAVDMSTASLNRRCRNVLGSSPQRYLAKRKVTEAKRLLKFTRLSISEIANDLGYSDTSYFCRSFKKVTSISPASFRRGASA